MVSFLLNTNTDLISSLFSLLPMKKDESKKLKEKYERAKNIQILEAREELIDSSIYALIEGYINSNYEQKFTGNWANLREIKFF